MTRKLFVVLMVLVLALSTVFATGSQEQTSSNGPKEYKDEVIIGVQTKTSSVDPTAQTSIAHRIVYNLTHNCLIGYDEKTVEIIPELAETWTMSEDMKTWTFNLRKDVTFHNGEKFTAYDVLFTW